jgi:archaellum component FlaG (FlaF/FlaG flagellin family)
MEVSVTLFVLMIAALIVAAIFIGSQQTKIEKLKRKLNEKTN